MHWLDRTLEIERIIIIGAGGFGREVRSWLKDSNLTGLDSYFAGFLDDDLNALAKIDCTEKILGTIKDFQPLNTDGLIIAIGDPAVRRKVVSNLEHHRPRWLSVIHETATLGDRCEISPGTIICPGAVVSSDVTIGKFCVVNLLSSVGHDASLGSFCTLSCHVDITGGCELCSGVFLGSHGCVMPNCKIGENAIVGAGAVVLRNVPKNATVFGNPAKVILQR